MPKFIAVTEKTEVEEIPRIRFRGYVDEDGDFAIEANGADIAFFDATDGKLTLMHGLSPIPGLAILNGKIQVSR